MANFDLRIQDYTGISTSLLGNYQTQMDDFMVEGSKKLLTRYLIHYYISVLINQH